MPSPPSQLPLTAFAPPLPLTSHSFQTSLVPSTPAPSVSTTLLTPRMATTTKPRRRARVRDERVAPPPPVARGCGAAPLSSSDEVIGSRAVSAPASPVPSTPAFAAPDRWRHAGAGAGAGAGSVRAAGAFGDLGASGAAARHALGAGGLAERPAALGRGPPTSSLPFSITVTHTAPPSSAFSSFSASVSASVAESYVGGVRRSAPQRHFVWQDSKRQAADVDAGSSAGGIATDSSRSGSGTSSVALGAPRTVSRYAQPVPKALPHEILPRRRGRDGLKRVKEAEHFRKYMFLRRQLKPWSEKFRDAHGRTPNLADVHKAGVPGLLERFVEYLEALEGLRRC